MSKALCSAYDSELERCNATKERDECTCGGYEASCNFYPEKRKPKKTVKDSGQRREFESGAVRDICEGKGRCDLLPLDIVAVCMGDPILSHINCFKETGKIMHLYDALDASLSRSFFETYPNMFLEVARQFEDGAKKYGDSNWQKGIPVRCYIDSATRHYLKHLRGDQDEPHDRAFVWNILCCIWTCKHKPELNDYVKKD